MTFYLYQKFPPPDFNIDPMGRPATILAWMTTHMNDLIRINGLCPFPLTHMPHINHIGKYDASKDDNCMLRMLSVTYMLRMDNSVI